MPQVRWAPSQGGPRYPRRLVGFRRLLEAVCENREELEYPADMYLEGSDQHRGWFQSSLLTSVGANGVAPYKAVVSQGFTLDGQGRKMSKSLGNVIDPNKVCDEMGADIIRLWVASVDTSTDVAIDHEILARTSDAYRRFRNTFRFLLGELEGQFEPETDGVPFSDLTALDQLMVARLTQVQAEVDAAYAGYDSTVPIACSTTSWSRSSRMSTSTR